MSAAQTPMYSSLVLLNPAPVSVIEAPLSARSLVGSTISPSLPSLPVTVVWTA